MKQTPGNRLSSLDILRGLTLFLLVFFQPVLRTLCRAIDSPFINDHILYHFSHETWVGFRFWDMIMPMFLFMCGITIPFSLSKYAGRTKDAHLKIFRRFVILFILGMVVQGNLLGLDWKNIYFYSNTLQAIACGYAIAALAQLHLSDKGRLIVVAALAIIYWIPMTFMGDFTTSGNFAEMVDRTVLGRFRDGVYWDEAGQWHYGEHYYYTWIWSSLTFGVTGLLGSIAGNLIKHTQDRFKTARTLSFIGLGLLAAGGLWSLQMPIIKPIWTSSMALWAGGFSYLALSLFYYVVDCKGYSYGLNWLKYYGMNSIVAYLIGNVISFKSVSNSLFHGFEQYLGGFYPTLITFSNVLILFFILRHLYRQGKFYKI